MKKNWLIVLAVVLSGLWGLQGAEAVTQGYIDAGENALTLTGVVGARYTGENGVGVFGEAAATSGFGDGVRGVANSTSGNGVSGQAWAPAGSTSGVYGMSFSTTGKGVYGETTATTGITYGVYGRSVSPSGRGVYGYAPSTTGITYGVFGQSNSPSGRGVYGYTPAKTGAGYGVYGQSDSTTGKGVYGYTSAVTGAGFGVYGLSMSTSGKGVYGYAKAASGATVGVYGQTQSPSGYGVYSKGNLHVVGNITASGSKSAVVSLDQGEGVTLYAVEASENWFEDAGSAKLENGRAVVRIEPIFARTVDTSLEYQVFLTPEGDCKGLYVTSKGESSFEVRELNGGGASIPFTFRVTAKRKGYADQRLVRVNTEQRTAMASPAPESEPVPEDE